MSDLEELLKIKITVLKEFETMFPNGIIKTHKDNNLCYLMKIDNTVYPVVDFNRTMPTTMNEYQQMINQSAIEFIGYLKND